MVYHKNFKEIPEHIPEIISNAVYIPNMINKETEYIGEVLRNLKSNIRDKQLMFSELRGNIPEKKILLIHFQDFFRYFVDSSDEEDEDEEKDVKEYLEESDGAIK